MTLGHLNQYSIKSFQGNFPKFCGRTSNGWPERYAKLRVDICNVADVIQEKPRGGDPPPGGRGLINVGIFCPRVP